MILFIFKLYSLTFNPFAADHDYNYFECVLLAAQITVIWNEMGV